MVGQHGVELAAASAEQQRPVDVAHAHLVATVAHSDRDELLQPRLRAVVAVAVVAAVRAQLEEQVEGLRDVGDVVAEHVA
eukprot:scaffold94_cov340-Prasinococcus_capsulatus_cf.AAC.24